MRVLLRNLHKFSSEQRAGQHTPALSVFSCDHMAQFQLVRCEPTHYAPYQIWADAQLISMQSFQLVANKHSRLKLAEP